MSATTAGNSATEPIHLLVALLQQEEGTARTLVAKAGVDAAALDRAGRGGPRRPAAGQRRDGPAAGRLGRADPGAGRARSTWPSSMKDDYVATEHLLIAMPAPWSLGAAGAARRGLTADGLREGLTARAREPPGDQPGRGVDVRSAGEVLRRPHRVGRGRPARPGHRPRRRDPPGGAGAEPAHQEQPGAHRRARRRQDRRRRGAGPARGRRRRARLPQGPPGALASTWPRWSPGRSTAASSRSGSRPSSRRSRTPAGR